MYTKHPAPALKDPQRERAPLLRARLSRVLLLKDILFVC